jgi:hypothetical protein
MEVHKNQKTTFMIHLSEREAEALRHYLFASYHYGSDNRCSCPVGDEEKAGNELAIRALEIRSNILDQLK